MSSHLGLLMLLVSDVPRAKAFYTEYLGLEVVQEFSSDEFVMLRSRTGQQWKAKSVEILGEVTDMGAGRVFTAKDPEGHYIQVFHLYPGVREMQKQMGM